MRAVDEHPWFDLSPSLIQFPLMSQESDQPHKSHLGRALKNLVAAQKRIRELQSRGMGDAELRRAMIQLGFGSVTVEEFMSAQSISDLAKLLGRNNPDTN